MLRRSIQFSNYLTGPHTVLTVVIILVLIRSENSSCSVSKLKLHRKRRGWSGFDLLSVCVCERERGGRERGVGCICWWTVHGWACYCCCTVLASFFLFFFCTARQALVHTRGSHLISISLLLLWRLTLWLQASHRTHSTPNSTDLLIRAPSLPACPCKLTFTWWGCCGLCLWHNLYFIP